jgi:hypothetical protein
MRSFEGRLFVVKYVACLDSRVVFFRENVFVKNGSCLASEESVKEFVSFKA